MKYIVHVSCCIQNTAEVAEVRFYISDFSWIRSLPNATAHSSIVGKCASVRQIESVWRGMLSKEDHCSNRFSFFVEKLYYFFFVISHNEIDGSRPNQWKIQLKSKWKEKYFFLSFVIIKSYINRRHFCLLKKSPFRRHSKRERGILIESENKWMNSEKMGSVVMWIHCFFLLVVFGTNWIISASKL